MSLSGCESIIPALAQIIDTSSVYGVDRITMGLTFRGRLNILANVVKKPLAQIFTAFNSILPNQIGSGDIKCQLGTTNEFLNLTSHKNVRISVSANPAHLGAIGAVVCGKTRAQMFYANDLEGKRCLPIIVHGDAEITGLGVCFETVNLSKLQHYGTHGTIHLIINNQMTGTTATGPLRSSIYCNSIGRTIDAPIIHVNGDDVPSVIYAAKLAAEYRARFGGDVFLDILGYRRFGVSETDSMQTEPIIYSKIKEKHPVLEKFYDEMLAEKLITEGEYQTFEQAFEKSLRAAYDQSKEESIIKPKNWLESSWQGFFEGKDLLYCAPTGIPEDTIVHIAKVFSFPPPGRNFVAHPVLTRILKGRAKMLENRELDWAMGEAIAFGSLLKDGIHVRLSGQDVERGTFGHRHHVIHHQTSQSAKYYPLSNLYPDQAAYIVCNSSLSEYGVLGFELGYSLISPNQLVMWEAQFGDFSNNAQVIFDQFIASGERKWIRQSGLVIKLPHGMEGMGSEHSNAHLERFLTLSNDDPENIPDANDELSSLKQLLNCNIIVANCTTPANYFHIIRRQILLPFRKPLFILTPKSLLRLPAAKSSFDDISGQTDFHRVLPESGPASENPPRVKKLLFCSGKVYYDLVDARAKNNITDQIAIVRVEQLAPFPYDKVQKELQKYDRAITKAWVSEEHRNTSAWFYVEPRFHFLGVHELKYIGRLSSSAPAAGYHRTHHRERVKMLEDAMAL
ncbi:2-oxoglutarate dehydrogenase, mitochondrial-like isoform X2 [Chrysoperla carnea]|nr:2-oxoglutarate dehydrogenase, mitochondrial-like isoform X2 [Chrysoperla carnea]